MFIKITFQSLWNSYCKILHIFIQKVSVLKTQPKKSEAESTDFGCVYTEYGFLSFCNRVHPDKIWMCDEVICGAFTKYKST